MRVFILLAVALSLFSPFVNLAGSELDDAPKKRKYSKKAPTSAAALITGGLFLPAAAADESAQHEARRRVVKRKSGDQTETLDAAAAETAPIRGRPKDSSKKAAAVEVSAYNKEDLLKSLDVSSVSKANFVFKLEQVGAHNIPFEDASELLVTAVKNGKDSYAKLMISKGFKFSTSTPENTTAAGQAFSKAIDFKKTEFIPALIDFDPETSVKLIDFAMASSYSYSKLVLDSVKAVLTKSSASIDHEAFQHMAECAAQAKSIELVNLILESNVLNKMISSRSLVVLFSDHKRNSQANYRALLQLILNERCITPPFAVNILLQAAEDNNMDFVDAIEPHLGLFNWAVVVKALDICLKRRQYYFADILLRSNSYSKSNSVFSLCSRETLLDTIAKSANAEILGRLVSTFYYDNRTLLLSDDCLRRICVGACYAGNVEVVDYFITGNYFNLSMRFKGKSILRMALESGNSNLAKHLIKYYGADIIFDSNTPAYNPSQSGGDSLIYVAVNQEIDMFKYLLKLGANPNAQVRHDDKTTINLVYWAIQHGQDLIVKALLDAGCQIDLTYARFLNANPLISRLIGEFEDRQTPA